MTQNERCLMDKTDPFVKEFLGIVISTGGRNLLGNEQGDLSVRSNNLLSSGLKSRPGSCPFVPVAQGSGVLVTEGREFPIGKATGRNASEPICSLVNLKRRCRPGGETGKAAAGGNR